MIRRMLARPFIVAAAISSGIAKALDRLAVKVAPPDSAIRKQQYWRALRYKEADRKIAEARKRNKDADN